MRRTSAVAAALAIAVACGAAAPSAAAAGSKHRGGREPAWGKRHHPPAAWARPAPGLPCRPPWTPVYRHGPHRPHAYSHSYAAATVVHRPYAPFSGGKEVLGNVIGGAVGGVLGSQIGKGSGRTAAVVGGTVLGVLVGGSVGRSMDAVDRLTVTRVLETAPTRTVVAWHNPDTRAQYEVTPLVTYQEGGRYCREYTATARIGGQLQQLYGTACRQPDGTWEVVR